MAITTHHCKDGQIQLLPDFRGREETNCLAKGQRISWQQTQNLLIPEQWAAGMNHRYLLNQVRNCHVPSERDLDAFPYALATKRRSDKPICDAESTGQAVRLLLRRGTSFKARVPKRGLQGLHLHLQSSVYLFFLWMGNMPSCAITNWPFSTKQHKPLNDWTLSHSSLWGSTSKLIFSGENDTLLPPKYLCVTWKPFIPATTATSGVQAWSPARCARQVFRMSFARSRIRCLC